MRWGAWNQPTPDDITRLQTILCLEEARRGRTSLDSPNWLLIGESPYYLALPNRSDYSAIPSHIWDTLESGQPTGVPTNPPAALPPPAAATSTTVAAVPPGRTETIVDPAVVRLLVPPESAATFASPLLATASVVEVEDTQAPHPAPPLDGDATMAD